MPIFELSKLKSNSVDLFVNTHSLSEMEYHSVNEYIQQITIVTRAYFYHKNYELRRNIGYGHMEIPAASFPINPQIFQLIYRQKAICREQKYWEYL
ncbi:MAG: hypothetical protein CL609_12795 [Anaerolineaceae bacterium]|nr:hypothetical protein [Anaerolineaceae bacterium]